MVCDKRWKASYAGAAAWSRLDLGDFFLFLGALGKLFELRQGKWTQDD